MNLAEKVQRLEKDNEHLQNDLDNSLKEISGQEDILEITRNEAKETLDQLQQAITDSKFYKEESQKYSKEVYQMKDSYESFKAQGEQIAQEKDNTKKQSEAMESVIAKLNTENSSLKIRQENFQYKSLSTLDELSKSKNEALNAMGELSKIKKESTEQELNLKKNLGEQAYSKNQIKRYIDEKDDITKEMKLKCEEILKMKKELNEYNELLEMKNEEFKMRECETHENLTRMEEEQMGIEDELYKSTTEATHYMELYEQRTSTNYQLKNDLENANKQLAKNKEELNLVKAKLVNTKNKLNDLKANKYVQNQREHEKLFRQNSIQKSTISQLGNDLESYKTIVDKKEIESSNLRLELLQNNKDKEKYIDTLKRFSTLRERINKKSMDFDYEHEKSQGTLDITVSPVNDSFKEKLRAKFSSSCTSFDLRKMMKPRGSLKLTNVEEGPEIEKEEMDRLMKSGFISERNIENKFDGKNFSEQKFNFFRKNENKLVSNSKTEEKNIEGREIPVKISEFSLNFTKGTKKLNNSPDLSQKLVKKNKSQVKDNGSLYLINTSNSTDQYN